MMNDNLLFYLIDLFEKDEVIIKGYEQEKPVTISGKKLFSEVLEVSGFLKKEGVKAGDRVAVIAEKCPDTIIAFFAIWMCGGIAVPVCETLKERELTFILKNSGSRIVLCSPSLMDKIKGLTEDLKRCVFFFYFYKRTKTIRNE